MPVRIGVEEEFHIVDLATGMPVSAAAGLLERLPDTTFVRELQQSVVETNSRVHETLDSLRTDLTDARRLLASAAEPLGLGVLAAGTPPLSRTGTMDPTPTPRYAHMMEEYAAVADEQQICAAQVHVDVPDRETGVRAMAWLAPWVPVLLALSASSPYWLGVDTGYASWRNMVMQRWPSSGPPGPFTSAAEYDAMVDELIRAQVLTDPGMVYFDLRPSAHQDTLELRVCDACPRAETVVMIAGLFRAMVVDACAAVRDSEVGFVRSEWLRAATWRAARSGLGGDLLHPLDHEAAPAADVVGALLRRHRVTLKEHGDWETVSRLVELELAGGGASHRLRQTATGADLRNAVAMLLSETRGT